MRLLALVVFAGSGCGRIDFESHRTPAIVEVASQTADLVTSASVTFADLAPGNALLLATSTDTQVSAVTSVTGGGVTWRQLAVVGGLGDICNGCIRAALWYGADSTGDDPTVTATFDATDDVAISAVALADVSGIGEPAVSGPAATADVATGTVVAHPGDLVIAAAAWDDIALSSGPTDAFSSRDVVSAPGGAWLALATAEARTGAVGTQWTLAGATQAWGTIIVALH